MTPLASFLTALVTLGLIAVIGALGWGVVSMARGGRFDREHADGFMSARVGIQAVTIVLVLVAIVLSLI